MIKCSATSVIMDMTAAIYLALALTAIWIRSHINRYAHIYISRAYSPVRFLFASLIANGRQICTHGCQAGYNHTDADIYVPDIRKVWFPFVLLLFFPLALTNARFAISRYRALLTIQEKLTEYVMDSGTLSVHLQWLVCTHRINCLIHNECIYRWWLRYKRLQK